MAIDAVTIQAAIGSSDGNFESVGPSGEVWAARSVVSNVTYTYLLVADLSTDWVLYPSHLGYDQDEEFWYFETNDTNDVSVFSSSLPLRLEVSFGMKFLQV